MRRNEIAKTLKIVGVIQALSGLIVGLVILSQEIVFSWLGIGIMVAGVLGGMFFVGISEIINLQQENLQKQDEVIYLLKYNAVKEKTDLKAMQNNNANENIFVTTTEETV